QQAPLIPADRHFLKRAARYQGTPRKPEAGSITQGTLAHYVTNTGYTPSKMLHRIKKEPEDVSTAVESQSYRNIGLNFKTEHKGKIEKIEYDVKSAAILNQSIDGDLQIIKEQNVVRRQMIHDIPSSSKQHQSSDAIEIMWEKPIKKRKDSVCEIFYVCDEEISPLSAKPQGKIIKEDIDLTGDPSPGEDTLTKKSLSEDTTVIPIILDSPSVVPVSPNRDLSITSDISVPSRLSDIHDDSPKTLHDSSVRDHSIPDKCPDNSCSDLNTTNLPGSHATSLVSPEVTSKSLRDPVPPLISTIPIRKQTRPVAIPTSGSSRKPSSMSPTPTSPMSLSRIQGSLDSNSGMTMECTPSSSTRRSLSPMGPCDMSSDEQDNRKSVSVDNLSRTPGSESMSSFSGFLSPEIVQHSTENIKQSEGEMEISYGASPLCGHSPGAGSQLDVDHVTSLETYNESVKQPLPRKIVKKPLLPIDLS
ncbi:unnamed protein product, partial [Meganyctiphanes norvegica]